jgi:hypothetical protein
MKIKKYKIRLIINWRNLDWGLIVKSLLLREDPPPHRLRDRQLSKTKTIRMRVQRLM